MIGVTIDIMSNRFPQLAGEFDQVTEDALDIGVVTCIETADPNTRRDTGALVANKTISGGQGWRQIDWNQGYAAHQNFGTIYMSGTSFANLGMDAAEPAVAAELGRFGR